MTLTVGLCCCRAVDCIFVAQGAVVPVVGGHHHVKWLWLGMNKLHVAFRWSNSVGSKRADGG
jgi:hypothetical protein